MPAVSCRSDPAAGKPAASDVVANAGLYNQAVDALSMRNFPTNLNGHDHFFDAFAKLTHASAIASASSKGLLSCGTRDRSQLARAAPAWSPSST